MLSIYSYTRIANIFRIIEALVVSAFFLYISTRLPFAVKIFGEYLRLLLHTVASPLFVFLLGNSIVFALILKSGKISSSSEETDLYEELVNNGEKLEEESEEVVFEDKEMICEESGSCNGFETDSVTELESPLVIRRTKSEKVVRRGEEVAGKRLRRSETEVGRKTDPAREIPVAESEMSNEEFQRTIEEFIAKQLKFRREESMAVVLQSQG